MSTLMGHLPENGRKETEETVEEMKEEQGKKRNWKVKKQKK